jgi:hypothetical protein
MNSIDDVRIDSGRFKYILIKVSKNGEEKYVVRGYAWAEYHGIYLIYKKNFYNLILEY